MQDGEPNAPSFVKLVVSVRCQCTAPAWTASLGDEQQLAAIGVRANAGASGRLLEEERLSEGGFWV